MRHINLSNAKLINFHPLGVVGGGSETQLQVGKKIDFRTWRMKGLYYNYTGGILTSFSELGEAEGGGSL